MGTLYLDRKDLELRHEGKHLCLYENGAKSGTVSIGLIDRIVIRGAVTLTSGAIGALTLADGLTSGGSRSRVTSRRPPSRIFFHHEGASAAMNGNAKSAPDN
jgi:hypothetical protein